MAAASSLHSKIVSLPALLDRVGTAHAQGRRIVHCHGCFDIVHPGHVRHLEFAARLGEILLVTISGDGMIDKGTGRPLIPEALRAENLAALNFVDWVYIDPHPTAVEIIRAVRPDIYLKGREYESNSDPRFLEEKSAVEAGGGQVVFSSGDIVFSSSALIAALSEESEPFHRSLAQLTSSNDLRPSTLESILHHMSGRRIIVIGEPIIDSYIHCERPEVAAEGPIMTLRPVTGATYDGGAAVIAKHIRALGGEAEIVTAIPENDATAHDLVSRLRVQGIQVHAVRSDQPVVEKQRYLVGHQKVMKVDLGRPITIDERGREHFVQLAVAAVHQGGGADAVIFADFGQGLLTPATLDRLIGRLRPDVPVLTGDVSGQRANLLRLHHLDLVCPTEVELREAMGDYAEGLGAIVWRWLEQTGVRQAMVTLGPEGVLAFSRTSADPFVMNVPRAFNPSARLRSDHIPALGPIGIDPLGCGDALLAAATLSLCAGASLVQAAYVGSLAATIESRSIGNVAISAARLRQEWQRLAARRLMMVEATDSAARAAVAAAGV